MGAREDDVELTARFGLIASVVIVGAAVHLVARQWHPDRLFLDLVSSKLEG